MAITQDPSVDVQSLTPFKKFIMTIGAIPTSYLESMTYAELTMWFCNYLQNTVIPTVNNNASAVEELQGLYVELKSYVEDYFDNLDVQEEINNKLDALVEDGTLESLIGAYIQPRIDAQNLEISEFKTLINTEVNNIQTLVNAINGSPAGVYATKAALEAADPNHNKIYVVSADGKWYYYDNSESAWTEGGVYQSTSIDPDSSELTNMVRGEAYVTDSNISDYESDIKAITPNRIYLYYVSPENVSNVPTNLSVVTTSQKYLFVVYKFASSSSDGNYIIYLQDFSKANTDINNNNVYVGGYNAIIGSPSFAWHRMSSYSTSINLNAYISSSNVTDTNKDLNNAPNNSITGYYLKGNVIQHAPVNSDNTNYYLTVLTYGWNDNFKMQICVNQMGDHKFYYRYFNTPTWSNWVALNNNDDKYDEYVKYSYLTSVIQEPLDIKNKNLTFAGDSITAGNFIGSTNVWAKWLSDKLDVSYSNKAIGGASFGYHEGYDQIIDEINDTTLNDVLFIAGGVNDYVLGTTKSDYTSALNTLCSWLTANYEGTVIFVTPINFVSVNTTNTIPFNWYREELTRIAIDNGYSVIAGNEIGFPTDSGDMATLLFYDTVHPSVTGQKMYANKVYQILNL